MCDELTAVYLVDANVLIDYLNSDISILTIYSKEIGQIYIPVDVLDRVKQMDTGDCNRFNLKIVEPTIEQYIEAGPKVRGLAFDDRICFVLAKEINESNPFFVNKIILKRFEGKVGKIIRKKKP